MAPSTDLSNDGPKVVIDNTQPSKTQVQRYIKKLVLQAKQPMLKEIFEANQNKKRNEEK